MKNTGLRFYNNLLFTFHSRKKDYKASLRYLLTNNMAQSELACFYYSQLGMYLSALKCHFKKDGVLGVYAKAVSYAAIGQQEESKKYIDILSNKFLLNDTITLKLATEIAGYAPHHSLLLIQNNHGIAANRLRVAILIYLGRKQEAIELLTKVGGDDILNWYKINLLPSSDEKLQQLNACLSFYKLDQLRLIDCNKGLCTANITLLEEPLSISNGPLVTILMTTFCSEQYVEMAINSLLSQTYKNIEIIVIDDASTDTTVAVIQKLAKNDDRVRYLQMTDNVGTFIAKNEGLKYAQGEFITCHDSDDWAHPKKIELQIEPLLKDPKLVCTTSQWIRMSENGDLYARKIFPLTRLNPASPLFRKKVVLDGVGKWEAVRTGADTEFLERMKTSLGSQTVLSIKKVLTIGSHREGSLMTDVNTGYLNGISIHRLQYWEDWMMRLILINNKI